MRQNPKDSAAAEKPRLDAMPTELLFEIGAALQEGADKYGRFNWREAGITSSVYFNATLRHLLSWWQGVDIDPDSGLPHITKAIASLMVLRDAQRCGMVVNDDRHGGPE